ncbi:hypothetical protein BJY00DRAFT_70402 [Aspergillus carlsbadensis]|nr:hypothetical protein BJY00DRAFT_70402 [Aspergillus carlsbadensis]
MNGSSRSTASVWWFHLALLTQTTEEAGQMADKNRNSPCMNAPALPDKELFVFLRMPTKSSRVNPKISAEFLPLKPLWAELGDQKRQSKRH